MDMNYIHIHNHHQHTPTTTSKLPTMINNTTWHDINFSMAIHDRQPNKQHHHQHPSTEHHHHHISYLLEHHHHHHISSLEHHRHHQQQVWPNHHLRYLISTSFSSFIFSTMQPSSSSSLALKSTLPIKEQNNELLIEEEEGEDEEGEELGAMKETMYSYAVMQPVDIDPTTIRKPKRRNVRISNDPQSVAARHRRERISEKIRILQRLVPGGAKMDTASMLDEAMRYVKFLKKQIRQLQQPPQPSSNHHHPPPNGWAFSDPIVGPASEGASNGNTIEAKVVHAPRVHHNNHISAWR